MHSAAARRRPTARRHRKGAAIYTVVVFNALLVGLLGLSALSVVRIERQQSTASSNQIIARENAVSAVAAAQARIRNDAVWRSTCTHNTASAMISFSVGSGTWRLIDMVDSSLSNNARHGVFIEGIGRCGNATWIERVEAEQPEAPLPTLGCAIHSHGRLRIDSGCALALLGGAGSTNDELVVDGVLVGNGECNSRGGGGTVTGSVTTGMTSRESPASTTLFATYRDLATAVPYKATMSKDLLGPSSNSYGGGTSANGMYYINAGSGTLTISSSRITGTLVVKGNVVINDFVVLQYQERQSPVLIVDGNLTLNCDSGKYLSEASELRNYNPLTSLFFGSGDLDTSDVYPSEIWGLVHVTGNLTVTAPSRIVGAVLVDGETRMRSDVTIQRDPMLFFAPPTGYWTAVPAPLKVKPTQWRRAAAN